MTINIREYGEGDPVEIEEIDVSPRVDASAGRRWVISASNECGHNGTQVDLLDVVAWVRANMPELLTQPVDPPPPG